jgi:hypothetical protein
MAPGYGLSDPMARYAIPHDPRLMGHRGPKKVCRKILEGHRRMQS